MLHQDSLRTVFVGFIVFFVFSRCCCFFVFSVLFVFSLLQVSVVVFHYFLLFKALLKLFNCSIALGLPPGKKQGVENNVALDIKLALKTALWWPSVL